MANEATKIFHGDEAQKRQKTARDTFEGGGLGSDYLNLRLSQMKLKKVIKILDLIAIKDFSSKK